MNPSFHIPGLGFPALPPSMITHDGTQIPAPPPILQNMPPEQVSALISQLQSAQNGLQPIPPPFIPNISQIAQTSSATAPQTVSEVAHAAQSLQIRPVKAHEDVAAVSEKEEGELSDASMDITSPVASPPVNRKRKAGARTPNGSRKARRMAEGDRNGSSIHAPKKRLYVHKVRDWPGELAEYRRQTTQLIAVLHNEGFTFIDILREMQNEDLLRGMYSELGLAVIDTTGSTENTTKDESATNGAPDPVPVTLVDRSVDAQPSPQPLAPKSSNNRPLPTGTKPVAPKPATPADRSDYLARLSQLRASKNRKDQGAVAKSPVVQMPPTATQLSATLDGTSNKNDPIPLPPSSQTTSRGAKAAEQQNNITELVRKKMELLKAQQKKREEAAIAAAAPPSSLVTSQVDPESMAAITDGSQQPRKRPVAADFLENDRAQTTSQYTRPFGQSRHNSQDDSMIIEVSDDDNLDADDKMEAEIETSDIRPISTSAVTARDQRIRDFPPLSDFPPRPATLRQAGGSVLSTPTVMTPGTASELEALSKREKEIANLKLRIAEHEKRKAASGKGKSGNLSPLAVAETLSAVSADQRVDVPAVSENLKAIDTSQDEQLSLPLVTGLAPVTEPSKRSDLQARFSARSTAIDAKKARMEEMQRQLEAIQKEYEEDMTAQEQLRAELEGFDVDTEGMSRTEMEAKKEEIVQIIEAQDMATDFEDTGTADVVIDPVSGLDSQPPIAPGAVQSHQTDIDPSTAISRSPEVAIQSPEDSDSSSQSDSSSASDESNDAGSEEGEVADTIIQYEQFAAANGKNELAPAEAHTEIVTQPEAETDSDMEESYAPDPAQLIPDDEEHEVTPSEGSEMDLDDSSSGSSDSDDGAESKVDNELEAQTSSPVQLPEEVVPLPAEAQKPEVALSSSDASMAESSSEDDTPAEQLSSGTISSAAPSAAVSADEAPLATALVPSDDLAPELQGSLNPAPSNSSQAVKVLLNMPTTRGLTDLPNQVSNRTATQKHYFTPYESPLRVFRKFRFHPEYLRQVPGGFRSSTYSHRIEAQNTLCPYEGAGGQCNDDSCAFQHFAQMLIPGALTSGHANTSQ